MTGQETVLARARLLNDTGRHDDALRVLGPALAVAPEDADVLGELGRAQLGRGELGPALEAAGAVVRSRPDSYHGHFLAALVLYRLREFPSSLAAASEAVRRAPEDPRCHRTLAWAAAEVRGEGPRARAAASHAVLLDPDDAESHFCVGTIAMEQAEIGTAEQAFAETLRLDPAHALARHNLAVLRTRQGRLAEAAEGLLSSAALDPRQPLVPHNLDRIVWRWLTRTHWGTVALYLIVRAAVEGHGADGPGLVWQAPIALGAGALVAAWWTRSTVLRLGAHARRTLWRVLNASRLYAVRFWCLAVAVLALTGMGLGYTGEMRSAATRVAIFALGGAVLASWGDVLGERLRRRRSGAGPPERA